MLCNHISFIRRLFWLLYAIKRNYLFLFFI